MYYAQLSEEGICVGISCLCSKINDDNLIEIDEFDDDLLGRVYDKENCEWGERQIKAEPKEVASIEERIKALEGAVLELSLGGASSV